MFSDSLPLPQYQTWLDDISRDDVVNVAKTLAGADDDETFRLLCGRFQFFDPDVVENFHCRKCKFTRPFTLAAVCGSVRVCDVMIRNGVDVNLMETGSGNNVLHCLVCAAFYCPREEATLVGVYGRLREIFSAQQLAVSLKSENVDGLRPLEFAVQQGTLKLMTSFFETRHVYVVKEAIVDVSVYRWFDVTEYALSGTPTSRSHVSPLLFLVRTDLKTFDSVDGQRMFESGPFADWMSRSLRSRRHVFFPWLFVRLFYVAMTMLFELDSRYVENLGGIPDGRSASSADIAVGAADGTAPSKLGRFRYCNDPSLVVHLPETLFHFLKIYLIVHSAIVIAYDTYAFALVIRRYKMLKIFTNNLSGRKEFKFAAGVVQYRLAQFYFAVFVIVEIVAMPSTATERGRTSLVIDTVRLFLCLFAVWTVLHVVQMVPDVGHVTTYIREMNTNFNGFVAFMALATIMFARLEMMFFAVNSRQGCVVDFGDVFHAYYSVSMAFLNTEDFTQFQVSKLT